MAFLHSAVVHWTKSSEKAAFQSISREVMPSWTGAWGMRPGVRLVGSVSRDGRVAQAARAKARPMETPLRSERVPTQSFQSPCPSIHPRYRPCPSVSFSRILRAASLCFSLILLDLVSITLYLVYLFSVLSLMSHLHSFILSKPRFPPSLFPLLFLFRHYFTSLAITHRRFLRSPTPRFRCEGPWLVWVRARACHNFPELHRFFK